MEPNGQVHTSLQEIFVKNVNTFSYSRHLSKQDERRIKYRIQRKERGFDDTELWNLDDTILRFTLPRLKIFRNYTKSYPIGMTFEEWQNIIDKMIDGIEKYIVDSWDSEAQEGIDLFFKYFNHLWD